MRSGTVDHANRAPCSCGGVEFTRLEGYSKFMRLRPPWGIVACARCGLVTRAPSLFDGGPPAPDDVLRAVRPYAAWSGGEHGVPRHLLDRLERAAAMGSVRRLLEVGAGSGAFMIAARDRGWEVTATELFEPSAEAVRAKGFRVEGVELVDLRAEGERFGLVHVNHVLEHVRSPASTLAAAYRLLGERGLLVVEVPNEFSSWTGRVVRVLGTQAPGETSLRNHEWFFTEVDPTLRTRKASC